MADKINFTYPTTIILQAVSNGYLYGFDIMDATGLPGGTVYPALRRMEKAGLVASQWENHEIAQREQRPPRKYYEITASGESSLAEAVKRFRLIENLLPSLPKKQSPSRG